MRRTLSWIAKSAGYHVDASRHYQICQDEGTWVLTSNGSLVRHSSTLREAKRAAENQEATGDQGRVDWTAISEGCGPTAHRGAFSDSASRTFCRLGPTACIAQFGDASECCSRHLGSHLRTPGLMSSASRCWRLHGKSSKSLGETRVTGDHHQGEVEHSRAMPRRAEGGRNRHQSARKVAVRPDIPGGDAVADKRRSGPRDALSVGMKVK